MPFLQNIKRQCVLLFLSVSTCRKSWLQHFSLVEQKNTTKVFVRFGFGYVKNTLNICIMRVLELYITLKSYVISIRNDLVQVLMNYEM